MKLKHHMEGGGVSWFRFHMGCYANEGLYCLSVPLPPLPPYVDSRGLSLPRKEVVKSGSYSKLNHEKIPLFFKRMMAEMTMMLMEPLKFSTKDGWRRGIEELL